MLPAARRWAPVLLTGACSLAVWLASADPTPQAARSIEIGNEVEASLAGGETHLYRLAPRAGGLGVHLRARVDQRGVDVVLALLSADGHRLVAVDSPNERWGKERLVAPLEGDRAYLVEVRAFDPDAAQGRYRLRIDELAPTNPTDRRRLDAELAATRAAALYHRGEDDDLAAALPELASALDAWSALGEASEEAEALFRRGVLERRLGRNDAAAATLELAAERWRELGEAAGEAAALGELGYLEWSRGTAAAGAISLHKAHALRQSLHDDHGAAIALNNLGLVYGALGELQQAGEFFRRAQPLFAAAGDPQREAQALNNVGGVYQQLGEPEEALPYYERALEIQQRRGDSSEAVKILSNQGAAHRALGEYQQALGAYSRALEALRELGDPRAEATVLNNVGLTYQTLGEPERALEHFERALPFRRTAGDRRGEATTLHNLGLAYAALGRSNEALEHLSSALELRRELGDRRGEATTLDHLGSLHTELGAWPEALANLSRALELRRSLGNPSKLARTLGHLSRVHLGRGEVENARGLLQEALELQRQTTDTDGEIVTLEGLALVERRAGRPALARHHLEAAVERIEALRVGVVSPALRASFLAARRQVYEELVDLLMAEGEPRTALEIAERSRARSLLELVAAEGSAKAVSVAEMQRLLDPQTLLLQYHLGRERSFLWVLAPAGFESHELPPRGEIEAAARRVHELWSTLDVRGQEAELRAAAELSEKVLGPAAQSLGSRRLVIVADGALHYVPFAALPRPLGTAPDLSRRPAVYEPLLARHEVVHLPSASVLAAQRSHRERGGPASRETLAIFADPIFDLRDPRVKSRATAPPADTPTLERLAASRAEAEAAASISPAGETWIALGTDAHLGAVTGGRLSDFRFVHFATHGVVDSRRPEHSGLVFSRYDAAGQPREGFLGLPDISNLELRAELVVLSGCRTALGREVGGEGLVGLVQGFLNAGADRVLASLWQVQDRATAELMAVFYRGLLAEGLSPAAALRAAQLEIWRQSRWKDPYYWSVFVIQGGWESNRERP